MPKKKNPNSGYFKEEQEQYFKDFLTCKDYKERDKIFREHLYEPFSKMISSIIEDSFVLQREELRKILKIQTEFSLQDLDRLLEIRTHSLIDTNVNVVIFIPELIMELNVLNAEPV